MPQPERGAIAFFRKRRLRLRPAARACRTESLTKTRRGERCPFDMSLSNAVLSQALLRLYAPATLAEFSGHVIECLALLFPREQFSVDEVFYDSGEVLHHCHKGYALDDAAGVWEAWAVYSHQNPLVRDLADQIAVPIVSLSDIISFRQFSGLDLYHHAYSRIDIRDQIAVCLPRPRSVLGISINASRICTAAQRARAELLFPHLLQAQQGAALATPRGFETLPPGHHHVDLRPAAVIKAADFSREARLLLDAFFGPSRSRPWQPPADLLAWIARRREFFREGNCSWRRFQPLCLRRGRDDLRINLAQLPEGRGEILTLLARLARPLEKAGALTPRETQVAHWAAQGKTNGEIAIILGISPLTVKTHVERILAKLGVENRVALAALRP
jgi:DNA-binding CsgD family transcriptional regulator